MDYKGRGRRTATILLLIVGIVVAVGAYYWFAQLRTERVEPTRPDPEWTTAPEGGVKVNLPETPMTNVPRDDAEAEPPDDEPPR